MKKLVLGIMIFALYRYHHVSPRSRDRLCSEVYKMKVNLLFFWDLQKMSNFERLYPPENEANHACTGDIKTTYFEFWRCLEQFSIDSTRWAITNVLVFELFMNIIFFTDNPPQAHVSRPAELQSLLNLDGFAGAMSTIWLVGISGWGSDTGIRD